MEAAQEEPTDVEDEDKDSSTGNTEIKNEEFIEQQEGENNDAKDYVGFQEKEDLPSDVGTDTEAGSSQDEEGTTDESGTPDVGGTGPDVPELTQEERNQKYRDLIQEKWLEYKKEIPEERWEEYEKEIAFEVETITSTNVSDYFLFNYELIKRSVAKGGIITRSGRGSAPSYLTNFFLGFTNIDRIKADVKMFPTRFLTADRILAGSLPDID